MNNSAVSLLVKAIDLLLKENLRTIFLGLISFVEGILQMHIYIYKDKVLLDNGFDSLGYALNFLPYDKEKAEIINTLGFGLNSLSDLKNYVKDLIELYNEFVDEYIKEIEAGNAQF